MSATVYLACVMEIMKINMSVFNLSDVDSALIDIYASVIMATIDS